ncbi:MAG: LysM peptidoglycan-binding domain-containing protein [Roseburia sp.]
MRSRREAEVRNQKILLGFLFMAIVLIVVSSILFFGTLRANAASTETSSKYYTSIQVEEGDTLWEIADSYMTDEYSDRQEYITEICNMNHISEDTIHAGQYLTIPYYAGSQTSR